MKLQQPILTGQGANSNSKEADKSKPVIWHDFSSCAFFIE